MDSEKFKKALRMAVNVGCGFEGDAEDAASLLSLIETNEARIDELEAEVAELKPYRDGYDPENEFPPEGEWVLLRDCDDQFEPVQYDRKMEWYWNYGSDEIDIATWDRFNGDLRRWYPIGKLPEVQE